MCTEDQHQEALLGRQCHICLYIYIYIYTHIYIYICCQIFRIVKWHKAQHELFQIVFPVQHSYLDTSTPKADYIITFLGFWELCFAGKTTYTSWPIFSLVSKMSEVQDTDVIDETIDQEIINLAIEATLNNGQNNLSKPWKDAINLELKALYAALKENQNLLETFTH